jgi:hypothetical protein
MSSKTASRSTANQLLVVFGFLFVAGAAVALLPGSPTHLVNDLGYHSLCPLAPWSSLSLLVPAGICVLLRNYVLSRKD